MYNQAEAPDQPLSAVGGAADGAAATLASPVEVTLPRRVFNLAWPVIGENFLQTMLGIVDTLLVAQLGTAAIAGVGSALQIMFFVIAVLSAISVGSSVLVAQAVGANNYRRASVLARQSLLWSVVISIPLAAVGLFAAKPIIGIFGMEDAVTTIGADYLRVVMGTVVVLTLMLLSSAVLRGAGDSRTPMLITAIANVVNVVLVYGLIFGKWGLPEMGVVGSAWGTFYSRLIGFALFFWVLWRGRNGVSIRGEQGWALNWGQARQMLAIGVPAALEQLLVSVGFLVQTILVAQLGTASLAAHRLAMNAMSLSFLPGFGFAMAATALVGQSIGARRPAEGGLAATIATRWALVWMSVLAVIFIFMAETIMGFFSTDPEVVALGAAGLRIVALAQPFWAISFVQAGALRGTGNTHFPLWVNTAGIWVAVLLGFAFVQFYARSLNVVWIAFVLTAPITAYLHWRRFRQTVRRATLAPLPATPPEELLRNVLIQ